MMPARLSPRFLRLFSVAVRARVRRTFARVEVTGFEAVREGLRTHSVIAVSNHVSYWDAMFLMLLARRLSPTPAYAWMHLDTLRQRPFFARLGAFGVQRHDPQDAAAALRYAARLLRSDPALLWIFPQGDEAPESQRPLGFAPGAAMLARLAPEATLVPVAIHYRFASEPAPLMRVRFGPTLAGEARTDAAAHERVVTTLLDALSSSPADGLGAWVSRGSVLGPSRAERLLSWLVGRV